MKPVVSIIVPVYKDFDRLMSLIRSIAAQNFDLPYEVIIADNEGDAKVAYALADIAWARYVCEKKPGSYAARNAALATTRGELVVFTDSDCRPDPNWLKAGFMAFATEADMAIAGGAIRVFPATSGQPNRWECVDMASAFRQEAMIRDRGVAVTANLWARKGVFNEIGIFDDRLMSGGDTAWCRHAKTFGYSVAYLSEAVVEHPARAERQEHFKKMCRVVGGLYARTRQNPKIYPLRREIVSSLIPPAGAFLRAYRNQAIPRRLLPLVGLSLIELYAYRQWCWAQCMCRSKLHD